MPAFAKSLRNSLSINCHRCAVVIQHYLGQQRIPEKQRLEKKREVIRSMPLYCLSVVYLVYLYA